MNQKNIIMAIAIISAVALFLKDKIKGTNFSEDGFKKALPKIKHTFGATVASDVEKVYRLETNHFKSGQFKATGTGGMEAHGSPKYYGWNKSFFLKYPMYSITGTYTTKENVTGKTKTFVVWNSIEGAMFYLADYIHRHNNVARWFSTDVASQAKYNKSLSEIKARFAQAIV